MGCQKVKLWWMRLVGYFPDNSGVCWLSLGSWRWFTSSSVPCPVRFGKNHGQILKLVHLTLLLVPHSTVLCQLDHDGPRILPGSHQGFPIRYSSSPRCIFILGLGVQGGISNGFFFQITACVFNVRLDAKFWIGYVGCSESRLALAVLGQKKWKMCFWLFAGSHAYPINSIIENKQTTFKH